MLKKNQRRNFKKDPVRVSERKVAGFDDPEWNEAANGRWHYYRITIGDGKYIRNYTPSLARLVKKRTAALGHDMYYKIIPFLTKEQVEERDRKNEELNRRNRRRSLVYSDEFYDSFDDGYRY